MKKVYYSLLTLCLFLGISVSASAARPPVQKAIIEGNDYTFNPEVPLLVDASQFSSNSISYGDSGADPFQNLIDGNNATMFHSYWDRGVFTDGALTEASYTEHVAKLDPTKYALNGIGWTNLQVELYDPIQKIIFTYTGRDNSKYCDSPNDIIIYATNDDNLGKSTLSTESAKWTEVAHLTDGFPKPGALMSYTSPAIDLGEPYKYIRFEMHSTATVDTKLREYARPSVTGVVFSLSAFQLYEAEKMEGWQARLNNLLNEITMKNYQFTAGKDPGLYPEDKVLAYTNAYYDASDAATKSLTEDQYQAAYNKLSAALEEVKASIIPMEDGYYNIVSAWNIFEQVQGVQKAWFYDASVNALMWTTYNPKDPIQLFKFEKQADGGYSVQNVVSKKYLSHLTKNGVPVPFSDEFVSEQVLLPFDAKPYMFKIYSPDFNSTYNKYNTRLHNQGNSITGQVAAWDSDIDGEACWLMKKVDGKLLDSLLNASDMEKILSELQVTADAAQKEYDKCYAYKDIVTDPAQITTNAQNPNDGSIAALLDNSTNTYFHSMWDASYNTFISPENATGWHNLQFALPEAVSKIKFYYTGRISSSGWVDDPDHITIYGTNDETLAASTAAADSSKWAELVDMTKALYDFPEKNLEGSSYYSPVLDLGGSYKYLRFVVKHTNGQGTMPSRTFFDPAVSGVTFELSEFRLWDGNPTDDSDALHNKDLDEACKKLIALITDARTKIRNKTATQADINALKAATEEVTKLYIDRDALYKELATTLNEANTVYSNAIGAKVDILTSTDQFSTNNVDLSDSGASSVTEAFEHLIDGNINTVFHSYWLRSVFSAADITEESYAQHLSTLDKNTKYVNGPGYHNLQIKLKQPVDQFYFSLTGRNSDKWHDVPNDIAIYVTNDEALGESTLDSETSQWKEITELNENMASNTAAAYYESPQIDLGDKYKYVRFVIKDITTRATLRPHTAPDITGVMYSLSEFHMYGKADPNTVPYYYIPEVKAVVDGLKALIDEYSKYDKFQISNTEPIEKLKAAIAEVRASAVDTTELVTLYNNYVERIGKSVVGEGIGFVDNQESLAKFAEAVTTAKASAFKPTKETVAAAVKAMKDAYKEFLSHVGQIVPNQWYNIISNSTREVFNGQPIYLKSTSVGSPLSIGDYDLSQHDPKTDPYAIFRFVPIEGTENFYVQNLGTGQYMGAYNGNSAAQSPKMQHEPEPYRLIYNGNGTFKITQAGNTDDLLAFKTDNSNKMILTYPLNNDEQQAFRFDAVTADQELSLPGFNSNSIQIVTLPYATKGELSISSLNDGIATTYAIKALKKTETGTRLELKKKADTEAGEPFVLVIGDYTQEAGEAQPLVLSVPETVVSNSVAAPGLVGTLTGVKVSKSGYGMFINNALVNTTSFAVNFAGGRGYIDPTTIVNEEGEADLVIETNETIDAIQTVIRQQGNQKVNVYTIDGKLLKRQVNAGDAKKELKKGLYIINKKKVSVR